MLSLNRWKKIVELERSYRVRERGPCIHFSTSISQIKERGFVMGNYRFKLSYMMPNAWFYKLKDMGRTRKLNTIHSRKKKQPLTSSTAAAAAIGQPSKPKQPHISHQRKSYYFARDQLTPPLTSSDTTVFNNNSPRNPKSSDIHFPDPPRKSSNSRLSTRRNRASHDRPSPRVVTSSRFESTSGRYSNSPLGSSSDHELVLPEVGSDRGLAIDSLHDMLSWSSSFRCSTVDKCINIDKSLNRKFDGFDIIPDPELPPIKTNKSVQLCDAINDMQKKKKKKKETTESTTFRRSLAKLDERNTNGSVSVSVSAKVVKEDTVSASKEQRTISPVTRFSLNSPGLKLRTNSPKIANRKIHQTNGRKSLPSTSSSSSRRSPLETLAIVKSSSDPQRDFRDSMLEMILENNIKASKDLEELLACYLSLNSDEYHEVIIKVFKQIWFDLTDTRLNRFLPECN